MRHLMDLLQGLYAALLIWCAIRLFLDESVVWQVETSLGLPPSIRFAVCGLLFLAGVLFVFPRTAGVAGLVMLLFLLVAWKFPLRQAIFHPGLHLLAIAVLFGWRLHDREQERFD